MLYVKSVSIQAYDKQLDFMYSTGRIYRQMLYSLNLSR